MTEERRGPEKPRKAGDRRRLDIEQTVEAASFMKAGAGKVPRVNGDAWRSPNSGRNTHGPMTSSP